MLDTLRDKLNASETRHVPAAPSAATQQGGGPGPATPAAVTAAGDSRPSASPAEPGLANDADAATEFGESVAAAVVAALQKLESQRTRHQERFHQELTSLGQAVGSAAEERSELRQGIQSLTERVAAQQLVVQQTAETCQQTQQQAVAVPDLESRLGNELAALRNQVQDLADTAHERADTVAGRLDTQQAELDRLQSGLAEIVSQLVRLTERAERQSQAIRRLHEQQRQRHDALQQLSQTMAGVPAPDPSVDDL